MLFSIPDDLLSRCKKFQPSSSTRTLLIVPQRNPCVVDNQEKKEDEIKRCSGVRTSEIRIANGYANNANHYTKRARRIDLTFWSCVFSGGQ